MFNLIGIKSRFQNPRLYKLGFANRLLDRRLQRALNWYRNNYYYVQSNHVLYKLIQSFGMPKALPDEYVETYIYNRAFKHGNAFGFTSDRAIGKLFYGNFYGINSTEVIVQVDNNWKWENIKSNWSEMAPVRILRHNQTHFSFNLLTHKNYVESTGLSIIEIDINLLHMQYLAWYRHHKKIKMVNPSHEVPDVGYFLGMVVLPNALASHFNQVIINQHCLMTDEFMPKTIDYVGTSFYINSNFREAEDNIKSVFELCRKNSFNIQTYCDNIIGVDDVSARDFNDTPQTFLTRNNKWVYLLACSRFIKHCLMTPAREDRLVNKEYVVRMKYELQQVINGKVFNDYKIAELKPYYTEEIEYLKNMY